MLTRPITHSLRARLLRLHATPRPAAYAWTGTLRGLSSKQGLGPCDGEGEGDTVYERKTPREHVLLRPGMYLGQVNPITAPTWVFNPVDSLMEKQTLTYSPALVKLFDEIIVNAADNRLRGSKMSKIDVQVKYSKRKPLTISVKNDGKTIPITFNQKENLHTPELIFGHLLTSSNFNDTQKKVTGGRHGYGAKLTNIFSSSFEVEIRDCKRKKLYYQKWEDNMSKVSPPVITDITESDLMRDSMPYTKITFSPDLNPFSTCHTIPKKKTKGSDMPSDSIATLDDTEKLLHRRLVDLSVAVHPVKINYNGKEIKSKTFEDYVKLFLKPESTPDNDSTVHNQKGSSSLSKMSSDVHVETINSRWTVGIIPSPNGTFEHMSFVNGIWTLQGGSHVNNLVAQCVKHVEDVLEKKYHLQNLPAAATIKNRFMIFVQCLVENPSFDSQSKDALTTAVSHFGSKCNMTKGFLRKAFESNGNDNGQDIIQNIFNSARSRERSRLLVAKKGQFGKTSIKVPKLEDAHAAGSKHSLDCTLILTEGESAKALARAGLEVIGREKYGILSLQGKILNVSNSPKDVLKNKELLNFGQAMGLNFNKTYEGSLKNEGLRYGHILIMTDQDTDGSHIKGLVLNFIGYYWPHLLKHEHFMQQFHTPLLKIFNVPKLPRDTETKGDKKLSTETLNFYSTPEYEEFRRDFIEQKGIEQWKKLAIKYYKGLGTSTSAEGKVYFSNLDKHVKSFAYGEGTENAISLAFSKDRVQDRKTWLQESYSEDDFIDPNKSIVTFEEFINVEMIQFSYADLVRSLPSVIDGLKPSQRKVLHSCFKRNLNQELKVVQLGGSVAEISGYHHGDQSLTATIVRMAQDYTGSNNVPLLFPSGQFGTRHEGGKDFASPRYIFTRLAKMTRFLFPQMDDAILQYQEEDGKLVEPRHFLPVIPLVLVNGSSGIGTGWSTTIPSFHPLDLIQYIRDRLEGKQSATALVPWVRGFKGSIEHNDSKFQTHGVVKRSSDTVVEILELPCYKWTNQYKSFLSDLFEKDETKVTDMQEHHTSDGVKFVMTAPVKFWDTVEQSEGGLLRYFKLTSSIKIENMHGFDHDMKLRHYPLPEDIVNAFIPIRLAGYVKRKQVQLSELETQTNIMSNKARFINSIVDGDIPMVRGSGSGRARDKNVFLSNEELAAFLKEQGYTGKSDMFDSSHNSDTHGGDVIKEDSSGNVASTVESNLVQEYSYLLNMSISSLTVDRANSLDRKVLELKTQLELLNKTTPEAMWLNDLSQLEQEFSKDKSFRK